LITAEESYDLSKLINESKVQPVPCKGLFTPRTYAELLQMPDKEWTVSEIFGRHDLMMVFGDAGTGKSFFIVDLIVRGTLGMCIANDSRFRCEPFRSLYCAEEGLQGLKPRFRAAFEELGESRTDRFDWLPVVPSLFGGSKDKSVDDFIDQVKASQFQPHLIVLDTLADAIAGAEENDNGHATLMMVEAKRIATEIDCAVCFVHHSGKVDKESQRGASAFRAKMDVSICVTGQSNPRTITCDKLKEGERWGSIQFDVVRSEPGGPGTITWHTLTSASKRVETTELWKSSIIQLLRDNAGTSEGAMSVRDIVANMSFPVSEKTARRWLAGEATDKKSPIEVVKKQVLARGGKPNILADHYWIKE